MGVGGNGDMGGVVLCVCSERAGLVALVAVSMLSFAEVFYCR